MKRIDITNGIMRIDTNTETFDIQKIQNRRFMYNPQTGTLILGIQTQCNDFFYKKVTEYRRIGIRSNFNEFIEKILVHERDRKGSIQTTQEVEIYFNFVGRFVPPAFGEVELTPEELEEIRKREERKDRLHQNYLKRKASGAQKRYEDKIKKRKKAEIEAKKAAIRAENIAKGVFVPVSSLPQREPQKGTQIA